MQNMLDQTGSSVQIRATFRGDLYVNDSPETVSYLPISLGDIPLRRSLKDAFGPEPIGIEIIAKRTDKVYPTSRKQVTYMGQLTLDPETNTVTIGRFNFAEMLINDFTVRGNDIEAEEPIQSGFDLPVTDARKFLGEFTLDCKKVKFLTPVLSMGDDEEEEEEKEE